MGSNGAAWQAGDKFVFDSAKGVQTFQYLSDLINKHRVSPPATDTNPPAGGDLSRDLLIQGKLALFESGAYNLANVQTNWGIATIPSGPAGAISVTNGIVAADSAKSPYQAAQQKVWQERYSVGVTESANSHHLRHRHNGTESSPGKTTELTDGVHQGYVHYLSVATIGSQSAGSGLISESEDFTSTQDLDSKASLRLNMMSSTWKAISPGMRTARFSRIA